MARHSNILKALGLVLLLQSGAYAENKWNGVINSLPGGMVYPTPVGILYPGFNIAAGVNAAALPWSAIKNTSFQAMYAPSTTSGLDNELFSSIATTNGTSGFGGGVLTTLDPTTNRIGASAFVGAGVKVERVSAGISVRDTDLTNGTNPNVDVSMMYHSPKSGPSIGMVLYHVDTSAQMDFGLGFSREHVFSVEVNFLLPPLNQLSFQNLNVTTLFSSTVYAGIFGLYLQMVTNTQTNATLGILVDLSKHVSAIVEYTTPNRVNGGFTINF